MAEDMAAKLQVIDSAILTDVVRQDQHSPLFEVTGWSVQRLSDKGVSNREQWLPLLSYSLDCADEVRLLMKKLGLL